MLSREYPDRPWLGVGAILIRNGAVLLVERGSEPYKGFWSLPGGVVETGETLRDAVIREMREETGLEVEPLEVVEVFESIRRSEEERIAYHYVVIDFLCSYVGGTLAAQTDAVRAAWFEPDALPEPMTSGAPRAIEKAFSAIARANLNL